MSLIIRAGTISEVLSINDRVPEFESKTPEVKLHQKLADTVHLILIAETQGRAVGFKVGYAVSETEFYSWLGAVLPEYRNQGIANSLRQYQENWATEHRYKTLSVKSMNRFPAMLNLLINSGYRITGYEDRGNPDNSKITFSKALP